MIEIRPAQRGRHIALALIAATFAFSGALAIASESASAAGNDVVVFDIDGTLTTDEGSNSVHPGAVDAVKTYKAKGYSVVYLTARWKPLQELYTRAWLAANGFPSLPLYMSSTLLLTDASKVNYKTATLAKIETGSPEVVYAYGDSSSDFTAYSNAGVAQSNVWALKRASASGCQSGSWNACLVNYTGHLPFIQALPPGS